MAPSETADGAEPVPHIAAGPRHRHHRPAAGIYGLIVVASVLATAGTSMRTLPLAVAVFTTLLIYWLAEEYAAVGEYASAGQMPTWARIRAALAAKWPMVSASYIPLVALLAARALGATPSTAALTGLIVVVALLTVYGWRAGRSAGLDGIARLAMAAIAGGLGVVMIVLKTALLHFH